VGGDKAIPYINIPPEDNPFLGYRGIRYWLGDRALARAQLRAILRAAATHNIKVMFPMVSTSDEVAQIHDFVRQTSASLSADSIAHQAGIDVGIMIEVPSAVLCAEALAQAVDFFSIGTNDLTQYLMAADRGNARVTPLTSPFQPAVLAAIRQVIDAAHAHGKWVGICGEMAGNPLLTRVLVGLGVDKLSMSAPAIAEVKRIVSETDYAEALALAREVLGLATAAEVEAKLRAVR
jgi:phosphoenolpyruvate-protein kinase (PTS system EI component)